MNDIRHRKYMKLSMSIYDYRDTEQATTQERTIVKQDG